MITQITAETLPPITHNSIPVITTALLAHIYGTTAHSITKNHRSNTARFVCGKHYFKVAGQELVFLRVTCGDLQISPKTRSLILWTERGAARHAKMLETDQAWEVFEKLEDFYFNALDKHQLPVKVPAKRVVSAKTLIEQYAALENAWCKVYSSVKTFDTKAADHMDSVMGHILMFRNSYLSKNGLKPIN